MDYIMMYLDRLGNAANIRRYLPKVQYPIGKKKKNSKNIHSGRNLGNSKTEYLNQAIKFKIK
jgi:hypothetical protein